MRRGQVQLAFLLVVLGVILFLFLSSNTPTFSKNIDQVQLPNIPSLTNLPKASESNLTVVSSIDTNASGEFVTRVFDWEYDNKKWQISLRLDTEGYATYGKRSRLRDYDLFASDPYDDKLMSDIALALNDLAQQRDLSRSELAELAISFVQSLPYTSDSVTTPFDEYPRFPYETLYDDGGDCEDTSILGAAMLQELGFNIVLFELPEHMALGVECDASVKGHYVDYKGTRYCYLETTGENWPIGKLPDEYKGQQITVVEVEKRPVLKIDFKSVYRYNSVDLYATVNAVVKNVGSETAHDAKVYVALQTSDPEKVWAQSESKSIELAPEDQYKYDVTDLHAPAGETFRIYVRAYGDNVVEDESYSEWITWN